MCVCDLVTFERLEDEADTSEDLGNVGTGATGVCERVVGRFSRSTLTFVRSKPDSTCTVRD